MTHSRYALILLVLTGCAPLDTSIERRCVDDDTSRAIYGIDLSHDGKCLVTYGKGPVLTLRRSGSEITSLVDGEAAAKCAAFRPGTNTILAGYADGRVVVWATRDGRYQPRVITSSKAEIASCRFSPDGRLAATGDDAGQIIVWDVGAGWRKQATFKLDTVVWSLDFSGDRRRLCAGGEDGLVVIWDLIDETVRRRMSAHRGVVSSVVFCPGGATLVTASHDSCVKLWNLDTETEVWCAVTMRPLRGVCLNKGGEFLAAYSTSSGTLVWSLKSRCLVYRQDYGNVSDVVFAPDGRTLICSDFDGAIKRVSLNKSLVAHPPSTPVSVGVKHD